MGSQTKLIKDILSLYDTILENKEVEEDASSLRNTIKSLGYTEKGSELTSGGNVNNEITKLVGEILTQYKKTNPNVNVKITSGNDIYHKKLKYKSQHAEGNAIDVVLEPYTNTNASSFIKILNDFRSKNSNFSYIDEYTNPSSKATGGHFHLQYGGNSTSQPSNTGNTSTNTTTNTTSFARQIGGTLLKGVGITEEKIYSSFGKDYSVRYGEIIIPKEKNEKIKSPVSGVIKPYNYNSNCDNQLVIKFVMDNNDYYLEYCGLKKVSVRNGDKVKKGDLLGLSDSDIKVKLYNSIGNKKSINPDLETKTNSKSSSNNNSTDGIFTTMYKKMKTKEKDDDDDITSKNNYKDGMFTNTYKTVRDTWFKKDKLKENIDRIKGLL